jgi:pyrimidine-nucleoside phosphorylase
MIHLGGKAETPQIGYQLAEAALDDGSALGVFFRMIDAQGGDISVFDDIDAFHRPGATQELWAWETGFISAMDTTKIGWAVQRTGAGREKAGDPVDPHAGIELYARRGVHVEKGDPIASLYATTPELLPEAIALLAESITISAEPPAAEPLVSEVLTREKAEAYLKNAVR